jgi:hypothetical protein
MKRMKTVTQKTICLGDLIVAVFDDAERHGSSPEEVSRLATQTVLQILRSVRKTLTPASPRAASINIGLCQMPSLAR